MDDFSRTDHTNRNDADRPLRLPTHSTRSLSPQYWELKKLENARAGRRLGEQLSMGEWILGVSPFVGSHGFAGPLGRFFEPIGYRSMCKKHAGRPARTSVPWLSRDVSTNDVNMGREYRVRGRGVPPACSRVSHAFWHLRNNPPPPLPLSLLQNVLPESSPKRARKITHRL